MHRVECKLYHKDVTGKLRIMEGTADELLPALHHQQYLKQCLKEVGVEVSDTPVFGVIQGSSIKFVKDTPPHILA